MIRDRKLESTGKTRKGKKGQKKLLPSQLLELEAKKREEELNNLRRKMREDQQQKFQEHLTTKPTHWRSSTKNKQIHGYSDMVLEHFNKDSNSEYSNPQSAQPKKRVDSKGKENNGRIMTKGLNIKKNPTPSTNIESNFNKALDDQNDEYREVSNFLGSIKMEKYKEVFIDNGIEDQETILELNESHLEQMNLPLGHKLKIMKKIKEARKQHDSVAKPPQPAPTKVAAAVTTTQASNSLLDGTYDEEANKKEFQEALNAWRTNGKPEEEKSTDPIIQTETSSAVNKLKKKKTVRFSDNPVEELLILDNNEEENEDNEAVEIKPSNKPTTEIKEGMIAFKGLSLSKNSFLFSEEANGSESWNVDLLSTVDHASTSPRESATLEPPKPKIEKEI